MSTLIGYACLAFPFAAMAGAVHAGANPWAAAGVGYVLSLFVINGFAAADAAD